MSGFSPPLEMPNVSMDFAVPAPKVSVTPPDNYAAIGRQFGKPEPQRSWLSRLLRPKTQGAE
jgi:hypothetical protein